MKWQVQEAKARFSEVLDTTLRKGPQIITRRGIETAVIVPMDEWNRLKYAAKPTLKDLLLSYGPRFEMDLPKRGKLRRRPAVEFD